MTYALEKLWAYDDFILDDNKVCVYPMPGKKIYKIFSIVNYYWVFYIINDIMYGLFCNILK